MSAGQPEEDEITWGSDELPIENLNSKMRDGETFNLKCVPKKY